MFMCKKTLSLYNKLIKNFREKNLIIKHGALGDVVLSMHSYLQYGNILKVTNFCIN